MTRINTNVPSLIAQNRLQRSNDDLQTRLTRLSTGLRINRGADDPAGLIVSETLRSEITSLNRALGNTRRADLIIATADSALSQVSNLLNDVRGLVVEAANQGALSDEEIAANQLQVDSSLEAINRIAQTTTFQGRKLLDGSLDFITQGGDNFGKIRDLNIDQANLGSAGRLDVGLEVISRARRAEIDIDGIDGGTAGSGTITLENISPDGEAVTQTLTTAAGGQYTIGAKDGGPYDGTAGNSVTVNVVSGETTATSNASTTVASTADGGNFSVSVNSGSQYSGYKGNALDLNVVVGNTATAQATSQSQDVNGSSDAFVIRAKAGGAFDGAAGNAFSVTVSSANGVGADADAAVDALAGTLDITVDDASSVSLADIKAALEADADFQNDFEFEITGGSEDVLFRNDGSDDLGGFALDGAIAGADDAAQVDLSGGVLTITVDDNTNRSLSDIKAAVDAAAAFSSDFRFNLGVDGTFLADGSDDFGAPLDFAGGANAVAEAALQDDVLTLTVSDEQPFTLADIATTLASDSDFDAFDLSVISDAAFAADGSDNVTDENLGSGTPGTDLILEDEITLTVPPGVNKNGVISIVTESGLGSPQVAVDDDGNVTVSVDDTATTPLSAIIDAINSTLGPSGYAAELTGNDGDAVFDPATDQLSGSDISGSEGGGLTADVVFELSGNGGSEVFNVGAGTSIEQLVSQINLVSDSTGVVAQIDGGAIQLNSAGYGSSQIVDLKIVDEGEGGNFGAAIGSGVRVTGADVRAKVNGIEASGKGHQVSINTSTLDLSLQVDADFVGTANFSITGGGALFQLGPDVVSNQQARIGIDSVNTARMGGSSGKLFELGSGEAAALASDPGRAAKIVNEAIDRVTSLRGRLGAFQRTTLDSNLVSLSDTVANLQEAESSIRDADFAAESAALTRAQILVQSGTSVLALANQNPQNVLSLLR